MMKKRKSLEKSLHNLLTLMRTVFPGKELIKTTVGTETFTNIDFHKLAMGIILSFIFTDEQKYTSKFIYYIFFVKIIK